MSKTWKYVLIFLGVFALAFCVALPAIGLFFFRVNRFGITRGFNRMPMFGGGGRMPMFGYQTGVFSGLGLLLRFLIPLVVIVLIVLAVVWLLRRRPAVVAATAAAPVAPGAVTHACPNCGRTVENSWVACPYCGAPQNQAPTPPPPPADVPPTPPPPDSPDAQI